MAKCEVCGNDYDKSFELLTGGEKRKRLTGTLFQSGDFIAQGVNSPAIALPATLLCDPKSVGRVSLTPLSEQLAPELWPKVLLSH